MSSDAILKLVEDNYSSDDSQDSCISATSSVSTASYISSVSSLSVKSLKRSHSQEQIQAKIPKTDDFYNRVKDIVESADPDNEKVQKLHALLKPQTDEPQPSTN